MRFLVLSSIAALLLLTPETATSTTPSIITSPDWGRVPTSEDLSRYYPERAQRLGIGGKATIDCLVDARGLLYECAVVSETPPDGDFGAAALRMARLFRLKPQTRDGLPVEGGRIRVPIVFVPPPEDETLSVPFVTANLGKSLPLDGQYVGILPPEDSGGEPLLSYIRLPDAPDRRKMVEARVFSVARYPTTNRFGYQYGFSEIRMAFDCDRQRLRKLGTAYYDVHGNPFGPQEGQSKWTPARKGQGRAGWPYRAMKIACSGAAGSSRMLSGIREVIQAARLSEAAEPARPPAY